MGTAELDSTVNDASESTAKEQTPALPLSPSLAAPLLSSFHFPLAGRTIAESPALLLQRISNGWLKFQTGSFSFEGHVHHCSPGIGQRSTHTREVQTRTGKTAGKLRISHPDTFEQA